MSFKNYKGLAIVQHVATLKSDRRAPWYSVPSVLIPDHSGRTHCCTFASLREAMDYVDSL